MTCSQQRKRLNLDLSLGCQLIVKKLQLSPARFMYLLSFSKLFFLYVYLFGQKLEFQNSPKQFKKRSIRSQNIFFELHKKLKRTELYKKSKPEQ